MAATTLQAAVLWRAGVRACRNTMLGSCTVCSTPTTAGPVSASRRSEGSSLIKILGGGLDLEVVKA